MATYPVTYTNSPYESQYTDVDIGIRLVLNTVPQFFESQNIAVQRITISPFSTKIVSASMKNKPYKTLSYQADYTSGDSVNQTEVGAIVLPPNIILQ